MATPLVMGDALKMVVGCYFGTAKQLGESVVFYNVNASGMDMEDFALAMRNRLTPVFRAWMHPSCVFGGVSVQRVTPNRTTPFYSLSNLAGMMASSAGPMPSQCSAVIRFRTAGFPLADPPKKAPTGRAYVPFPAALYFDYDDNVLTTAGFAALDAISQKIGPVVNLASGQSFQQMVLSKANTAFVNVTAHEPLLQVGTQRRRGSFGQLNRAFGG